MRLTYFNIFLDLANEVQISNFIWFLVSAKLTFKKKWATRFDFLMLKIVRWFPNFSYYFFFWQCFFSDLKARRESDIRPIQLGGLRVKKRGFYMDEAISKTSKSATFKILLGFKINQTIFNSISFRVWSFQLHHYFSQWNHFNCCYQWDTQHMLCISSIWVRFKFEYK